MRGIRKEPRCHHDVPAIYHFSHGKNLEAIATAGELRASATAATTVDIADAKIKGRPPAPRGHMPSRGNGW